jgi:hypothetical protein
VRAWSPCLAFSSPVEVEPQIQDYKELTAAEEEAVTAVLAEQNWAECSAEQLTKRLAGELDAMESVRACFFRSHARQISTPF